VRLLGIVLCFAAAYRLLGTPLQLIAAGVAVASVACAVALPPSRHPSRGRIVTGLQHVCVALGGFLLFVSIAMR